MPRPKKPVISRGGVWSLAWAWPKQNAPPKDGIQLPDTVDHKLERSAEDTEKLARAHGYPYPAPADDFLFQGGQACPLPDVLDLADRTPVIAVGSNRAPDQLVRKFGLGDDVAIPVTWGWLSDFDSVYAGHISRYGAIPATLWPSPGSSVRLAVTWLDAAQLERMHETEAVGVNYDFRTLTGQSMRLDRSDTLDTTGAYITRRGAFAPAGKVLALKAIQARDRIFPACSETAALQALHAVLKADGSLDDWVLSIIDTPHRHQQTLTDMQALLLLWEQE